jgi:hypothetical protein
MQLSISEGLVKESQYPKPTNPTQGNTKNTWGIDIRKLFILILALGAIVVLIALIFNFLVPQLNAYSQSSELEKNKAKWESHHITHYRMSVAFLGYGFNDNVIWVEVKEGKVISLVDSLGNNVPPENIPDVNFRYPNAFTIPGLFSYAHQTILAKPPSLDISYDLTFGYPKDIYIDPYVEPCCQDFDIVVRDFQVLP